MIDKIEPRHDAPLCKCGEGLLVPFAYDEGMTRPKSRVDSDNRVSDGYHVMLRCTATSEVFGGWPLQAAQSWWSVGAHEQRLVDEIEIAKLRAEVEVQSREITRLRELLAGQGVLDFAKPMQGGCLLCEDPSFRGDLVGDHPACPECHTPWPS